MNSRRKGAAGEREFAAFCREHGYEAERTAQHCGKTGQAADVRGLPGIHIEVKRTETFSLYTAMEQAKRDNHGKIIPIVAHRRNRQEWVIVMEAKDWFKFYERWLQDDKGS